jgi:hypothetical protein
MNSLSRVAVAGLALAWLAACGSPTPHKTAEQKDAASAPDVEARHGTKDETVFDDLIRTENRARAVEGTVMQGKANTDAAIEAAQNGSPPPPPEPSDR